jgi:hypothetical protein
MIRVLGGLTRPAVPRLSRARLTTLFPLASSFLLNNLPVVLTEPTVEERVLCRGRKRLRGGRVKDPIPGSGGLSHVMIAQLVRIIFEPLRHLVIGEPPAYRFLGLLVVSFGLFPGV